MNLPTSKQLKIENLLDFYESTLPKTLDDMRRGRKSIRMGIALRHVALYELARAIHAFFIENDVDKCKQCFYRSSRLTLKSVGLDGGANFETGRDIQIALLSDCPTVIDAISRVETKKLISQRNDPLASRFYVYMLQLAIRRDDQTIRKMIERVARHGRNPWRSECMEGRDFFSLLLNEDSAALKALIQTKDAPRRSQQVVDEDFLSYYGSLETKLCLYRGVAVEIDHPLVPMELMNVRPLVKYEDQYDFLDPDWKPISRLEKFSKLFLRK